MGIPGEDGLIGHGVHCCATCDGPCCRGEPELVVIGGGNAALEESLFLAGLLDHVTIVTRGELRASELVQDRVRAHPRIRVHTGIDLVAFQQHDGRLVAVVERVRSSGRELRLTPAAAFVFVGLDPNTQFLRGSVDLDAQGFIRTDDGCRTSIVGLFAAGGIRAGSTKQAGSAAGEGIASPLAARRWLEGRHLVATAKTDDEPAA